MLLFPLVLDYATHDSNSTKGNPSLQRAPLFRHIAGYVPHGRACIFLVADYFLLDIPLMAQLPG